MRKSLALVMAVILLLLVNGAIAQTATDAIEVATVENGTVVPLHGL